MENKSKSGVTLSVIELSNYNAPETVDSYTEKGYVTYGPNNSYFKYLNECYKGSTTNRSVINTVGQLIYGKGLDFIDSDKKEETLDSIHELFSSKDLKLLAMDLKEYSQCCFQVGYNSDHTEIIKIQHHPVSTIAKGKMDRYGNIKKYWYSANFENTTMFPPKSIPAFGTSNKQVELFYISNYICSSDSLYYADVDYQAGLQYAKIEEEISNFHLNNIMNGFAPGMLLTFRDGKPSAPEQTQIENKVKSKWGGSSKAGSVMISYVDAGEEAPTLEVVKQSDLDKQYQFVTDLAENKILVSHRVTSPLLLGIKDAAGFSSNSEEMKTSYKLFNTTVINPFQDLLIEGINEVLKFNGIEEDTFFVPLFPIDFVEEDVDAEENADEIEKETGVKTASSNKKEPTKTEE